MAHDPAACSKEFYDGQTNRYAPDHDTLVDRVEDLMKESATLTATLRDQFAMAALTGLLAGENSWRTGEPELTAYRYADAMMEARKL